jgi:hypothetical protein
VSTWHAAPQLLARFAMEPERLDNVTASSIEAHLVDCDHCRRAVADSVEPSAIALSWNRIVDEVDRPQRSVAERILGWMFPDDVARVVAATPALRLSWLVAVVAVIAAAVAASRTADDLTPFLAFAPLVPLAGVALSFWPAPDPAGEAALATPMHGAGLVLRRTVIVLATSLVVLLAGTAALPGLEWRAVGWILPAIGLSLVALALSTWLAPLTATVAAAIGWEVAVVMTGIVDRAPRAIADGPLFGPVGQLACALLIPPALVALSVRQLRLSTMEAR